MAQRPQHEGPSAAEPPAAPPACTLPARCPPEPRLRALVLPAALAAPAQPRHPPWLRSAQPACARCNFHRSSRQRARERDAILPPIMPLGGRFGGTLRTIRRQERIKVRPGSRWPLVSAKPPSALLPPAGQHSGAPHKPGRTSLSCSLTIVRGGSTPGPQARRRGDWERKIQGRHLAGRKRRGPCLFHGGAGSTNEDHRLRARQRTAHRTAPRTLEVVHSPRRRLALGALLVCAARLAAQTLASSEVLWGVGVG